MIAVTEMVEAKKFQIAISQAALACYMNSKEHGFWDDEPTRGAGHDDAYKAMKIALMHSELSEMLEAVRKPREDHHCPEFSNEVIEAADLLIRLLDYCGAYSLPLGEAVLAKMKVNAERERKHGKAF